MTINGLTGVRYFGAAAAPDPTSTTDDAAPAEPTAEEKALAEKHPPGMVQIERSGAKYGLGLAGGAMGLGGAGLIAATLINRGGGASRILAAPLLIGGGLLAGGIGAIVGSQLIKPEQKVAVATNFATRTEAQLFANKMVGRETEVVEDVNDKFAVIDNGPVRNTRGYDYGRGHYYGDGHFHGQHYYGDGHNHHYGYYEPYYPGHGYHDYYPSYPSTPTYPDPWDYYPTPSGGSTSRGDDYYPGGGSSSGGTSRGDDYPSSGGGSYDPPSYDPPSYDPPSYDPPSYDPPSYDPPSYDPPSYDPPSYDPPDYGGSYGGDSSSNGNPDYDDF